MIEIAFLRLAGTYMNEFTGKDEQASFDTCGAIDVESNATLNMEKGRYFVSEFLKNPLSWLETESLYMDREISRLEADVGLAASKEGCLSFRLRLLPTV
jgi:hypothetical protein